jgi:DnaD/phage-associated family protein
MGELTICNDYNTDSTLISNLFIDEYMKEANDAQIKIYLYLVRQMSAGRATSIAEMADQFNHTEKEVIRSLKYWEKKGLISLELGDDGRLVSIHLCDVRREEKSVATSAHVISITPAEKPAAQRKSARRAPAKPAVTSDITAPSREELFFIVEQYIGKPLSVTEMQKINYIADDLHFSNDLIDYLVQYCVGSGKKDFRYIQKVAINWAEEGITTTGQARENTAQGPAKARSAKRGGRTTQNNAFNKFSQNKYDFEELEKKLLNN